ncbi:MAG: ATP-binding protein [Steroidobacteraceae bacterium]|nr:HAMP domain-containing protein [Pseudomonadota bacterium]MBP6107982.1 HAMP domain-containing protein [Steroidobacteraceae bacterium]MBP7015292.1 HAMP domain-containing protein [Steroidobacteraceae bacterium]
MNSLRNRLLAWLLGAVALVGATGAWVSYRNALAEANSFFDDHLRQTALLLRDQAYGFSPTPGLPQEIPDYDFVVQVWTLDGVRVYLSRPHTVLPGLTTLGLSTVATPNGRWRVFGVEARGRIIQVAQPMNVRERRAARLALKTIVPFAFLLPALAFVVVLIVGRTMRPVRQFAAVLRSRKRGALDPLDGGTLPDEIRPVATALNDLLVRLKESVERERSFIADAAHELRTPFTALDLQVQSLRAETAGAAHDAAVQGLETGVARATRLVEQLLALAREERDGNREHEAVALVDLARDVIEEMLPLADTRGVDLGMERADTVRVGGDREALRVLIRNLLDNAIRYSPAATQVDVSVERRDGAEPRALLVVSDGGPGIPPPERERVFDRFYRVPGTASPGSGLGLALVRSIAAHHHAHIQLGAGPDGRGLRVSVEFAALGPP